MMFRQSSAEGDRRPTTGCAGSAQRYVTSRGEGSRAALECVPGDGNMLVAEANDASS